MQTPLHIAYVLKRYPRLSETFIVNEMSELRRQGVRVTIIADGDPGESLVHDSVRQLDAPIYYTPDVSQSRHWSLKTRVRYSAETVSQNGATLSGGMSGKEHELWMKAAAMAPLLRALGVSHIHAHFATGAATLAGHLSRMSGIGHSFTAHAKDIYHQDVDPAALAGKIAHARFVVTVTDYNKRYLDSVLTAHQRQGEVRRIYNGLSLSGLRPSNAPRDERLVLGVGRLVQKKGFETLIAAIGLLRDAHMAVRCDIIGDGEERPALAAQIDALGLGDRVRLCGAMAQHDVLERMRQAAVFALPCRVGDDGNMDALPTVLLEAMALGTPVISTPLNGIPEMIHDGRSGLLVAERDPAALAQAIKTALARPELRASLGAAGRERVRADFDIEANVRLLRGLFEQAAWQTLGEGVGA